MLSWEELVTALTEVEKVINRRPITYVWESSEPGGGVPTPLCPEQFLLLVFSVTPFKIDQNKNKNLSIDKGQNLGNERRYIYKDPRQDSGQRNISYTR